MIFVVWPISSIAYLSHGLQASYLFLLWSRDGSNTARFISLCITLKSGLSFGVSFFLQSGGCSGHRDYSGSLKFKYFRLCKISRSVKRGFRFVEVTSSFKMVFFNCDKCGEALKKNQVERHNYRCRYVIRFTLIIGEPVFRLIELPLLEMWLVV